MRGPYRCLNIADMLIRTDRCRDFTVVAIRWAGDILSIAVLARRQCLDVLPERFDLDIRHVAEVGPRHKLRLEGAPVARLPLLDGGYELRPRPPKDTRLVRRDIGGLRNSMPAAEASSPSISAPAVCS